MPIPDNAVRSAHSQQQLRHLSKNNTNLYRTAKTRSGPKHRRRKTWAQFSSLFRICVNVHFYKKLIAVAVIADRTACSSAAAALWSPKNKLITAWFKCLTPFIVIAASPRVNNKKALLSQRRPRDAPNIWVPWKGLRVLANAPGYFSRNL